MQAVALFKSYFGGAFEEDAIRNNFVLIYELLDGKHLKATTLLGSLAFTFPLFVLEIWWNPLYYCLCCGVILLVIIQQMKN